MALSDSVNVGKFLSSCWLLKDSCKACKAILVTGRGGP
jgi:hypothetical protein